MHKEADQGRTNDCACKQVKQNSIVKLSFQGSLVITLPVDIINLELQRDMRGIRPHGSMAFGVEWSKKTQ